MSLEPVSGRPVLSVFCLHTTLVTEKSSPVGYEPKEWSERMVCLIFLQEVFHLVEGSGYFLVNSSEQDIVTIIYAEAESSIQVGFSGQSAFLFCFGVLNYLGVCVCLSVYVSVCCRF